MATILQCQIAKKSKWLKVYCNTRNLSTECMERKKSEHRKKEEIQGKTNRRRLTFSPMIQLVIVNL